MLLRPENCDRLATLVLSSSVMSGRQMRTPSDVLTTSMPTKSAPSLMARPYASIVASGSRQVEPLRVRGHTGPASRQLGGSDCPAWRRLGRGGGGGPAAAGCVVSPLCEHDRLRTGMRRRPELHACCDEEQAAARSACCRV